MSNRGRRAAAGLLAACLFVGACSPTEEPAGRLSTAGRLSGDTSGYRQVTKPRPLRFPDDHGPHSRYKHEWWYVTGQVIDGAGRRFGFQFTLFREAVSPGRVESPSRWATGQVYLAHVAITDVKGERYLSDERFARGSALGLAGAEAAPFRAWLEDWELNGQAGDDGSWGARAVAGNERFGFDLALRNTGPPVAHGRRGYSVKGAAGNASYYYSYTRLAADGSIRIGDRSFEVVGDAWFDHEWSSSALKSDQSGWDWFSLQLSNDAELMVFRLRHRVDPARDFYSGTYVSPTGVALNLEDGRIRMKALDHWTSDATGVRYPVRWRITVPELNLALTTEPWLKNQEFVHSFRYWEGAVRSSGKINGAPIEGVGYVELAGYAGKDDR